jgi:hypothetical protein
MVLMVIMIVMVMVMMMIMMIMVTMTMLALDDRREAAGYCLIYVSSSITIPHPCLFYLLEPSEGILAIVG